MNSETCTSLLLFSEFSVEDSILRDYVCIAMYRQAPRNEGPSNTDRMCEQGALHESVSIWKAFIILSETRLIEPIEDSRTVQGSGLPLFRYL